MSKKLRITLLIEAAVCFVVALSVSGAKAEWVAFPYAQIGTALRALSLSGAAGNLIAWAILILIACLPLGWLAFAHGREKAPVRSTDKVSCSDGASDTDECGAANTRGCDGAANNDECDGAANTRGCDGATETGECGAANNGKCSAANACGCDGAANNDECGATNACGCDGAANNDECDGATDTGECGAANNGKCSAANACGCDGAANNDECGAANARGCDGAANNDECDGATDTGEYGAANACGCGGMTNNDESDSMNARSRDSAAVCGRSYRGIFRGRPENWLMVLLSGFLIPGIYGAVNPEWLAGVLGLPDGAFSAAMASGCLNAILVAYIALRILRRTREGGRALLKGLNAMLIAAMIALVAAASLGVTANVQDGFLNVAAGNTEGGLGMTCCMLILGGIVDALPMLGDLWALDAALGLVSARMNGEDGVSEAERLARRSSRVIAATVLSRAALNLLAALTARWNRTISLNVNLPVESLLIALALMLAARGIAENKRLRDDNALFI